MNEGVDADEYEFDVSTAATARSPRSSGTPSSRMSCYQSAFLSTVVLGHILHWIKMGIDRFMYSDTMMPMSASCVNVGMRKNCLLQFMSL